RHDRRLPAGLRGVRLDRPVPLAVVGHLGADRVAHPRLPGSGRGRRVPTTTAAPTAPAGAGHLADPADDVGDARVDDIRAGPTGTRADLPALVEHRAAGVTGVRDAVDLGGLDHASLRSGAEPGHAYGRRLEHRGQT